MTGHRLGPKLAITDCAPLLEIVRSVLGQISRLASEAAKAHSWAFNSVNAKILVISALAEGADRIVAQAAIDAVLPLNAILPFARAEYRKDFASESSRAEFDRLLEHASPVLEIDGDRALEDRAYEAAGLAMLVATDLLIAIWDQERARGTGGTGHIVERAIAEGMPVILLDPKAQAEPVLLWTGDSALPVTSVRIEDVPRQPLAERLAVAIEAMLAPPEREGRSSLVQFYNEVQELFNPWPLYSILLALIGVRKLRKTDFQPPPYLKNSTRDWQAYFDKGPREPRLTKWIRETLLPAFAFADNLSVFYAQKYRSAYVFNFTAAVIAVTFALVGLFYDPSALVRRIFEFGEITIIVAILLVVRTGSKAQWHKRSMEYRRLAEWLRHLRILSLTAARSAVHRPGRASGDGADWVSWYTYALDRQVPLPNTIANTEYLERAREVLKDPELAGQINYNRANARRMHMVAERLHKAGHGLFWMTLITCSAFLILNWSRGESELGHILAFFTAFFPTLGAALNAIRVQGDFETVAHRSKQTEQRLTQLSDVIGNESLQFARLSDRMEKAADLMTADLSEWQTLFMTRPLSLPS